MGVGRATTYRVDSMSATDRFAEPSGAEKDGDRSMRPESIRHDALAGPVSHTHPPVLCGVDDGAESRTAGLVAVRLAEALSARLVLAHVMPSPDAPPSGMASQRDLLRNRAVEAGRRLLREVAGGLLGDTGSETLEGADTRVDFGDPARRLAEAAEEIEARVIVVGARGRGLVKVAVAGSVSQTLAAEQSRPVLVVPPETEIAAGLLPPAGGSRSSVVCGVDGSDGADRAARVAAGLASSLGRRLILAHAEEAEAPTSREEAAEFDDLLDSDARPRLRLLEQARKATGGAETELRLISGDPAAALEELAVRESTELIAVGTRGHGAVRALALGSVSRTLAESSSRPVLIVNEP
jgi:nucleotide-binding universal stress UspA family protein